MQLDPKIFKAYDIRGIYPDEINEQNIVSIIKAIYKFFLDSIQKEQITVALGYDMRMSSPQLVEVAEKTLLAIGAQYIDALFKKVPADLVKMNFELDGSFPVHQPDPLHFENLKDLQAKVLEEKADFGLAPDGDGDRLFFINEKGQIVPATIIT